MLDPTATFDHMIALLVPDPARREALLSNRVYQHISRSLSGTLEYMAVERVHELFRTGRFDRVVLDTPPTGNAVDFLEAPDRVATFSATKSPAGSCPQRRCPRGLRACGSRAGAAATSLIARVAGPSFVDETVGFFAAFSDLLAISARARRGRSLAARPAHRVPGGVCAGSGAHRRGPGHQRAPGRRRLRATRLHRQPGGGSFPAGPGEIERAVGTRGCASGWAGRARADAGVHGSFGKAAPPAGIAAALHAEVVEAVREFAAPRPVFTVPRVPVGETRAIRCSPCTWLVRQR